MRNREKPFGKLIVNQGLSPFWLASAIPPPIKRTPSNVVHNGTGDWRNDGRYMRDCRIGNLD